VTRTFLALAVSIGGLEVLMSCLQEIGLMLLHEALDPTQFLRTESKSCRRTAPGRARTWPPSPHVLYGRAVAHSGRSRRRRTDMGRCAEPSGSPERLSQVPASRCHGRLLERRNRDSRYPATDCMRHRHASAIATCDASSLGRRTWHSPVVD
jgi:hypothetical protein